MFGRRYLIVSGIVFGLLAAGQFAGSAWGVNVILGAWPVQRSLSYAESLVLGALSVWGISLWWRTCDARASVVKSRTMTATSLKAQTGPARRSLKEQVEENLALYTIGIIMVSFNTGLTARLDQDFFSLTPYKNTMSNINHYIKNAGDDSADTMIGVVRNELDDLQIIKEHKNEKSRDDPGAS